MRLAKVRTWFAVLMTSLTAAVAVGIAPPAAAAVTPIGNLGETLRVEFDDFVADVTVHEDGRKDLRDVHREMRIVRLGQGVDATGRLAPEALERTRAALVDYASIAKRRGVERVRMVATSATRDAANREDFEQMVLATLGRLPDVVPGREEAELSFLGATASLETAAAAHGTAAPRAPTRPSLPP